MKKLRQTLAVRQPLAQLLQMKYIFILLGLLLAGCTTETGRTLRHADSVMEEHPDSAMSILKGIDRKILKESELPYYALLYTQAQVKTDVPLDSDSLISIAYAKYGNKTSGDLGIRSNFYSGEIFFNQQNYREAMPYYLTAYEESKRLGNDYWHAKAAERISNIFFYVYNYEEAAKYVLEAADCYKCAYRLRNNMYALGQLAIIYVNDGNADRAYVLLDSLKALSLQQPTIDTAFIEYIKLPLVDAKMQTGRILDAGLDSIEFFSNSMSGQEKLDAVILQSQVYDLMDKPEEVKDILENAEAHACSNEDMVHLLYARYQNAKASGDSSVALSLVDSMLYYQNIVTETIIQESITGVQRDFYSERSLQHENKSRLLRLILYGSIGVFLLLLIFCTVVFILKIRTQEAESKARLEAFLSLKSFSNQVAREKDSLEKLVKEMEYKNNSMVDEIQSLQNARNDLELDHNKIIEKLFKEKWATLDTLCDQYFGLGNSELSAKDLVNNMEKELKKIVSKKGLAEIVASVDIYMGGIITDLRTQCPFLKEADLNFLALLFAGFSVRAVCMFTGIKYDYFYVKKSRLIKRIEASEAPDKSIFLQKLK